MAKIFKDGEIIELSPEEEAEFEASRASLSIPTVADYQRAVQSLVDRAAQEMQFNDGVTLASYKDSTNPLWAAQAGAFIAWRDEVWAYSYEQLAAVQSGSRPQPTVADFIAELPPIQWP